MFFQVRAYSFNNTINDQGDFMKSGRFVQRWKRFDMMFRMLLPDQKLRYFPPDFVMRNPVMSLLSRARKRGETCGVILLHLDGLQKFVTADPEWKMEPFHRQLQSKIIELAPRILDESRLIAAAQPCIDTYCLFIGVRGVSSAYKELTAKAAMFQHEIRSYVRSLENFVLSGCLDIQVGVQLIDAHISDTEAAARMACHYAMGVATKKLPAQFSQARQDLVRIIEQEEVTVLAQPIILLSDGEIFGWEILTRGPQHSPFHGPDYLFEFAYQADLLSRLEFLIFRKTFEKIAMSDIREPVFLNVTAVTLCHPLLDRHISELLQQYPGVRPDRIVFELTERHFIRDYEHAASVMRKLRERGFRFAVDDAGSGYSSLQTISELIPDMIKIDKSVIRNIDQLSVKESLLQALLNFARKINCKVIAEGVERAEEANILFRNNVHLGQGFYFARPTPLLFSLDGVELEQMRTMIRNRTAPLV
jgi:EAL domain-containing protein (putative c-di-GMP-specific phosphodiesterase class I)